MAGDGGEKGKRAMRTSTDRRQQGRGLGALVLLLHELVELLFGLQAMLDQNKPIVKEYARIRCMGVSDAQEGYLTVLVFRHEFLSWRQLLFGTVVLHLRHRSRIDYMLYYIMYHIYIQ